MERYKNLGGDSGVEAFEIGLDDITIKFRGTMRTYTYSHSVAGREHVENMKELARAGTGLNAYINRYVKYNYD